MNVAIFAPITINSVCNCIQLKKQSQTEWDSYYIAEGDYNSLLDILNYLESQIALDGYWIKLQKNVEHSMFVVQIGNTENFSIQFSEDNGCDKILGFESLLYVDETQMYESDISVFNSLLVETLMSNKDNVSSTHVCSALSYDGLCEVSFVASSIYREIILHALDQTAVNTLCTMWNELVMRGSSITLIDNWQNDIEITEQGKRKYKPVFEKQNELVFKRAWPSPHPLYYNTEILLEVI